MSRYRPPAPKKSPYISASGFEHLQQELKQRWQLRKEVTIALSAAAAEGDRSENAEYIYRKKQLREIDYRIRYLQKRLPELTIVNSPPTHTEQIFFGAWVTLEDEQGESHRYRIMGPDELDPGKGIISIDSPVAQALMKKKVDDEIKVQTPMGEQYYDILDIDYSEAL
ncbi:Transcription elongation factor GreB [hydrothermal vent metagenome]|uniref:Transcription elongation factor GreA n=1 Tax=hydrothermal vent metagenome TaxID=652676 RepID=A0A3B1B510_9ZZZZ